MTGPNSQTTFYITESSAFRNQMLYFRHDDWEILCAPLIDRLTSETFEKMTEVTAIFLLLLACALTRNYSPKLRSSFGNANSVIRLCVCCRKRRACGL